MKRIGALVLALVLVVIMVSVAGCGSETTTTTSATTPSTIGAVSTTATTGGSSASSTETTAVAADNQAKYGGTLSMSVSQSPGSPAGLPWGLVANDSAVLQTMIEPLFRGTPDGKVVPWLADSLQVADDHMSVTIKLKQGIKFHDGSALNADVAKWNLEQQIANKKVVSWQSVDKIDDYTVRINLSSWSNTVYNELCDSPTSWMISKDYFDKNGEDAARNHPTGTGPFMFKGFQQDASYDVVRNPDYWQKGLPYLDGIHYTFIQDATTKKAAVMNGEVQVIELDPDKLVGELEQSVPNYEYHSTYSATIDLVLDTGADGSPFQKKQACEAVEYAIDKEAIAKTFSYGLWTAPDQIPTPAAKGVYDPNFTQGRKYDPAKAKQLLAEAGYANGFSCKIIVVSAPLNHDIFVAVQSYLKEVGINADVLFTKSQAECFEQQASAAPGCMTAEPISPIGNFNGSLVYGFNPKITNQNNPHWLRSAEYADLFNKSMASVEYDPALAKACTDYMWNEASVIPIAGAGKGWLTDKKVMDGGWYTRSFLPWWTPEACYLAK